MGEFVNDPQTWGYGILDIGGGTANLRHLISMIRIFLKSERIDFSMYEEQLGGWKHQIGDRIESLHQEIEDKPEF